MSNDNHIMPFMPFAVDFGMDFCHQWAGGVEQGQVPCFSLLPDGTGNPMRGENQDTARRDFIQVFDEDSALCTQVADHIGVMDDFMPDIDGWSEQGKSPLNCLDGAFYASAETTGLGEDQFHAGKFSTISQMAP